MGNFQWTGFYSPLRSLPKKLATDRIETCICWRLIKKSSLTVSS